MGNPLLNIHKDDQTESDSEKFDAFLLALFATYVKAGAHTLSLKQFDLINTLQHGKIGRRFGLKNQQNKRCYLQEIQYAHRYGFAGSYASSRTIDEYRIYPFFLFQHQTNLGHVLIRPETIADKISELIKPVEIDFKKHKKFSAKYYVLADDSERIEKNMPDALLEYLKSKKGLSIEFLNDWCLIRNDKVISTKNALDLCEMAFEMKEILDARD